MFVFRLKASTSIECHRREFLFHFAAWDISELQIGELYTYNIFVQKKRTGDTCFRF